jgi:hypothetical protein
VRVPPVVGLPEADAVQLLEDAGFEVEVQYVDSDEPAGRVVASDPAAGQMWPEGDTVVLQVSEGTLTTVPDVVDRPLNEAQAILTNAGFEVNAVPSSDDATSPDQVGRVQSQDPEGGQTAARESTVTIFYYPDRPDLAVPTPTVNGLQVQVQWDNDIYGGVIIDWGDGSDETFPNAVGNETYTYEVAGDYTITVRAADPAYANRQVQHTVQVE